MTTDNVNPDRLNHAPDKSTIALLMVAVINDLEFDGGEKLFIHALPMAVSLATLKKRAKAAGIPAIYANDNFGRWQSDFRKLVQHYDVRGKQIVANLVPEEDDYFVLKPKHSAFFQTAFDVLLKYLGAQTLILTGLAGDNCVLFSANDAYMRDFKIIVPSDCTVSEDAVNFRMGDVQGGGGTNERPLRTVRIEKPFAVGRYEVTIDDYIAFALSVGRPEGLADWRSGGNLGPKTGVSWDEAVEYSKSGYLDKRAKGIVYSARRSGNMQREGERKPPTGGGKIW